MKKYLFLIIAIIIMPSIVLADSAGPAILGYEAVISNKDGVKFEGESFAYNTKIHVTNEMDGNVSFCLASEYAKNSRCEDGTYETKASNVTATQKEVTPESLKDSHNNETSLTKKTVSLMVINKNGVKLSKGPADVYEKYDKVIPNKTILTATYYINPGLGSMSWCYIDSNGYKGWVEYGKNIGKDVSKLLIVKDVDLLDESGKKIDTIPVETVIDTAYYSYNLIYVKYGDKEGYIDEEARESYAFQGKDGYILTLKETKLLSGTGETLKIIPVGEKIKILYAGMESTVGDYPFHNTFSVNGKFYIEYDGKKGFVSETDVDSLYYEYEIKDTVLKEDTKLYNVDIFYAYPEDESIDVFMKKYKSLDTIAKGSMVTTYKYDEYYEQDTDKVLKKYLVKYNGKIGTIVEISNSSDEETPTPSTTPSVTPTPKPTKEPGTATKSDKPDTMIIICIVVSVIVGFIAIVAAVSINKKTKKQANNISDLKKEDTVAKPTDEQTKEIEPVKKEE